MVELVADSGLLLLALAVLLVTFLVGLIVRPLVESLLRGLPLPGVNTTQLATQVGAAIQSWVDSSTDWANGVIASTVVMPINALQAVVSGQLDWSGAVTGWIGQAGQVLYGNLGYLLGNVQSILAQIAALGTQVVATGQGVANLGGQLTHALTVTIPGMIGGAVAGLHAALATVITATEATLGRRITDAEANASAGLLALTGASAAAEAALRAQMAAQGVAIERGLTDVAGQARTYVDAQVGPLQQDWAGLQSLGGVAAIAATITGVGALAQTLTTTIEDCVRPTCSALPNGLSLFALLGQGVELALIIELLGKAYQQPEQAARDMVGGVSDLRNLAGGVLGAIGVQV